MPPKYNQAVVEQEMQKVLQQNPNAAPEVIEKKKSDLICRETIYAIWMDHHARFGKDGKDAAAYEAELRSKGQVSVAMGTAIKYFQWKNSPDKERLLESFQKAAEADTDGSYLEAFEKENFHALPMARLDHVKNATTQGDAYVMGMFAPVTDSSGMRFEGLQENGVVTLDRLRHAQKQADAITIKPPEGMSDRLATYVVMGEFFKDEHLDALKNELHSGGSTLPDGFSMKEDVITTFFESTLVDEPRPNMQACRLAIPQARQAAKVIIEGNDQQAIQANLKNAFNIMYDKAASSVDVDRVRFCFSVRHANQLVDAVRESGMDLEALGITEEKLNLLAHMTKAVKFVEETGKLWNNLERKGEEYLFSGFSKETDPVENKEIQDQLYELQARKDVMLALKKSQEGYHKMYEMAVGGYEADDVMRSRGTTEAEQRLMEDEEGMLKEAREFARSGESQASYERQLKTPGDRLVMMELGIEEVYRHVARPSLPDFVEKGQPKLLDYLESYAAGKPGSENLQIAVQSVREAAENVRPDSSWEAFDTLLAPYKLLQKEANDFSNTIKDGALSTNKDDLQYLSVCSNLKDVVKLVERNPVRAAAQAEHEKKRKALHESVRNDALKYDHAMAKQRIDAFRQENPQATKEQLAKAEVDITIDEARIYTRLSAYERCVPGGTDFRNFQNEEKAIRAGTGNYKKDITVQSFFKGKDRLTFAMAFQNNFERAKDAAGYENMDGCMISMTNYAPGNTTKKLNEAGDGVFNALFAPKTNRSGIRMEEIQTSGSITQETVEQWQNETDAIEIPTPENMSESLVSFMVLGRTMQKDLLQAASAHVYGPGSTMPKDFSPESNVKVSLWDNMMRGDARGNMHCIRSVVPQARREVKNLIVQGNDAELKNYLKTAFDVMFDEAMNMEDHRAHTWTVPMRQIGRLMEGLENSGMTPQSIGIDPAKLEKYNDLKAVYGLVQKSAQVQDEAAKNLLQYFNSGFSPAYDPTGDTPTRRLIEESKVLEHAENTMRREIGNYKRSISWMGPERISKIFTQRELFPSEKLCVEDTDAFVELMGREIRQTMEDHISRTAPKESSKMGLGVGQVRHKGDVFLNQQLIEGKMVGTQLEEARDVLAGEIFNDVPNVDSARRELDELIAYRNSLGSDLTPEKIQTLAEPYEQLHETLSDMLQNMPGGMMGSPQFLTVNDLCADLLKNAQRIRKEPERVQHSEQMDREFTSIRQGMRPAFMERYASYRPGLEKLGTEGDHSQEFQAIISSMDRLQQKLTPVCSDRNAILSRTDASELKKLYAGALKSTADFINVSKKSPRTDDRTFMATEMLSLLARDMKLFEQLPRAAGAASFSDAMAARYDKRVSPEDSVDRFRSLADKLSAVGSRFGGNSREFDNMKKALDEFRQDGIDRKKLRELSETLARSAEEYITAKSVVPRTGKGKQRLQLARELRELCTEVKQAFQCEDFGSRQKKTSLFREKPVEHLQTEKSKPGASADRADRLITSKRPRLGF